MSRITIAVCAAIVIGFGILYYFENRPGLTVGGCAYPNPVSHKLTDGIIPSTEPNANATKMYSGIASSSSFRIDKIENGYAHLIGGYYSFPTVNGASAGWVAVERLKHAEDATCLVVPGTH